MSVEGCPLSRLPQHVVDGGPSAIIQVKGRHNQIHSCQFIFIFVAAFEIPRPLQKYSIVFSLSSTANQWLVYLVDSDMYEPTSSCM